MRQRAAFELGNVVIKKEDVKAMMMMMMILKLTGQRRSAVVTPRLPDVVTGTKHLSIWQLLVYLICGLHIVETLSLFVFIVTSALQKATLSASSLAFASVNFFLAFSALVLVCCILWKSSKLPAMIGIGRERTSTPEISL